MYSVVLMAALTTGAASEGCHWGCHRSCFGGGYGGCFGGCYGCYGGGYGGCFGGCYGCYGGGYGGCFGGCYGGYGCAGCYGGGWSGYSNGYYGGTYGMPGGPTYMEKAPVEKLGEPKKGTDETSRARVIIDVPAQAKLFIDDQPMSNKAGKRTFVTPPLQPGQTYYYDVKLVVVVDGQERVDTTRVTLRPGDVVAASFANSQNSTATARANNP
jgi:uncharacterized protein (TIGR03000 family)